MRQIALLLLLLIVPAIYSQSDEGKAVLNLLGDMKAGTQKEIDAIDAAWKDRQSRKQQILNTLSKSIQEQRGECSARDGDVAAKQHDIDITNEYINWMEKRQEANNKRVEVLEQERCHQNNIFVNDIRNHKVAQSLARFLEKELVEQSLLQKHNWTNKVTRFVQKYSGTLLQSLDDSDGETIVVIEGDAGVVVEDSDDGEDHEGQENSEHSDEHNDEHNVGHSGEHSDENNDENNDEHSVGHSGEHSIELNIEPSAEDDNESESGDVQESDLEQGDEENESEDGESENESESVPVVGRIGSHPGSGSYQASRSGVPDNLPDLLQVLREGFDPKLQDAEVKAALTFIDFKLHIERENQAFDKHILEEKDNIARLTNQLITRKQASTLCQTRLGQLNAAFGVASEDLKIAETNYQTARKSKEEELDTFDEVFRIYQTQVK